MPRLTHEKLVELSAAARLLHLVRILRALGAWRTRVELQDTWVHRKYVLNRVQSSSAGLRPSFPELPPSWQVRRLSDGL